MERNVLCYKFAHSGFRVPRDSAPSARAKYKLINNVFTVLYYTKIH